MTRITNILSLGPLRLVQVIESQPEPEEPAIETEGQELPGLAKCSPSNRPHLQLVDTGEPVERDERGQEVAFPVADGWEFLQAQTGGAQ